MLMRDITGSTPCSGIILAGGRATRLQGRDKGLLELAGEPLLAHVLRRLRPQVDDIVINANRHLEQYAAFGWPVVPDHTPDFAGPLAGIQAALPHCRHEWVLVVACDCPLLPTDLAQRLFAGLSAGSWLAIAHDGKRLQPLCLLLHKSLQLSLDATVQAGHAKVERWCLAQAHDVVTIADVGAFRNINTEEDLREVAALLLVS